jgi:AraC-like DNA-binding protein
VTTVHIDKTGAKQVPDYGNNVMIISKVHSDASKPWDISPTVKFYFGSDYILTGQRYEPDDVSRITVFTITAGDAVIETDGKMVALTAGQTVLIDANRTYAFVPSPDKPHLVSWAESEPLPGRPAAPNHGRVFRTTPRIEALIELGLGAGPGTYRFYTDVGRYLGHALLIECDNAVTHERQPTPSGQAVPKLEQALRADLRHDWTAPEMASAIHLSQRTLTRRLRSEAGLSATALLWKVRIRQGVSLLTRSDLNGSNVAELCGFKSAYHFSRRIKQATGMSPTALREWASTCSLSERRDLIASL